jgi:hypothetical protein
VNLPIAALLLLFAAGVADGQALRPPATPLIAVDPYFSVWSTDDTLSGGPTRHWTGAPQPLSSLVRIDGQSFRLMGAEPRGTPALAQTRLEVLPTHTNYEFAGQGVALTLSFMTPTLPDNLDVLARPVTYVTWRARAADGGRHAVSLYFDAGAELAVNRPDQQVVWGRVQVEGLKVLEAASREQPVLQKWGDDLRIDWGYLYVASGGESSQAIGNGAELRQSFSVRGRLPESDDLRMPRFVYDGHPTLAFAFDLGSVGGAPVSRRLLIAYDDQFSIEYMYAKLRPYWRRHGMQAAELLSRSWKEAASLEESAERFDRELMADLGRVGGPKYAQLAALCYRQAFAAQKLAADVDGKPLFFPKENFSNGCIGTVDVIYPAAPILLLLSPRLMKASLDPVFRYALMDRWKFPFAPHDLGTYPLANGQVYGGGERSAEDQMPVEESANMLLLAAAVAQVDGNTAYLEPYWPLLHKWAEYLREKGLDPENQLCTDDFAGHLAHNVNLSAKAILALGAYGKMCALEGRGQEAAAYDKLARGFAARWVEMADDGGHYRLTFDKPGTWSQKYNLVWDNLLDLHLFPAEVARREIAFYKGKQNRYGLPLDNRHDYTKLDWTVWTATLASSQADFELLVDPLFTFAAETPDRVPLTDWYETTTGKRCGFQARSVVGGVYIKMLADRAVWKKWAALAGQ